MSHKYAHIHNLSQLEDEMLKLKLRKTIIRNEVALNAQALKEEYLSGKYLFSLLIKAFGRGKSKHADREADGLDRLAHYSSWISNIFELVNALRK